MKIGFIGDIHAKFKDYHDIHNRLIEQGCDITIQLGDYGLFRQSDLTNVLDDDKAFLLRGNHDNPEFFKKLDGHLNSGRHVLDDGTRVFVVNGASSIDRFWRCDGLDWWADEQHFTSELENLLEEYKDFDPDILVGHTLPASIPPIFMGNITWYGDATMDGGCVANKIPRTELYLQEMLDFSKPKMVIGGHWHVDWLQKIDNTVFTCLNELSTLVWDTTTMEPCSDGF